MMSAVHSWLQRLVLIFAVSGWIARANAADLVLQLSSQPALRGPDGKGLTNTLLRELQRQAVLIAARDELHVHTRDMALNEPFAAGPEVVTLLMATTVHPGQAAQLWLADLSDNPLASTFQTDNLPFQHQTTPATRRFLPTMATTIPQSSPIAFDLGSGPFVDYPYFIEQCERMSRQQIERDLQTQLKIATALPQRWLPEAPADTVALDHLLFMDVFSQFLAVQILDRQIENEGSSPPRLEALVRGYANLGWLTQSEWCTASKAFTARALLYAQRLVVLDPQSALSFYTRAYAMAMASLQAQAMADLDRADQLSHSQAPQWVPAIRGYARTDLHATENAIAVSARYRPLAVFLTALVALDDRPIYQEQYALDRAIEFNHASFCLRSYLSETLGSAPVNIAAAEFPQILVNRLRGVSLPAEVSRQLAALRFRNESFDAMAGIRDQLNNAASAPSTAGAVEPSWGMLAGLIEQEEFACIASRSIRPQQSSPPLATNDNFKLVDFVTAAKPIIDHHPWGPFIEAQLLDSTADAAEYGKRLGRVQNADPGWCGAYALQNLVLSSDQEQKLHRSWQTPGEDATDDIADDFTPDLGLEKPGNYAVEQSVWLERLMRINPYCCTLHTAWMNALPEKFVADHPELYREQLHQVETEFSEHPQALISAADWCDRQSDFSRGMQFLIRADQIDPASTTTARLARSSRKLGFPDTAIAYARRAMALADADPSTAGNFNADLLCQLLMENHRYEDVITSITADSAFGILHPPAYLAMACAYDHLGELDEAAACFRKTIEDSSLAVGSYYLWARRTGRSDVDILARETKTALADSKGSDPAPRAFALLATGQDRAALELIVRQPPVVTSPYVLALGVVLAREANDQQAMAQAQRGLQQSTEDASFAKAFSELVGNDSPDLTAFDRWTDRQLDTSRAVDWYWLAGRYLLAVGQKDSGMRYLRKAIGQENRAAEAYNLAWLQLKSLHAIEVAPSSKPTVVQRQNPRK